MKSGNITVTDARLKKAFTNLQQVTNDNKVSKQISEATEEAKLKTGVVNKYYVNIDKVEVTLNDSGETVMCRLLQLLGSDFDFKYTPTGDYDWDTELGTGYVVPRAPVPCVVLPTGNTEQSTDYFLLGYYNSSDEPDGVVAPPLGNVKLTYISAVDEYLVQFGSQGFNTISASVNQYTGVASDYTKPVDDLATKETLTEEYYTREEVDKLLEELREELTPETEETTGDETL